MKQISTRMNTMTNTHSRKDEELQYKIEIATQTLERNIGFITNCDNKTSIVLSTFGVLLTIILTNDGINKISYIVNCCFKEKTFCNIFYLLCLAVSLFITGLGLINLCKVLFAKTTEEARGLKNANSRIFFTGIQNNGDFNTFSKQFSSMTQKELLDELIEQIYINSCIAAWKYKTYNSGFKQTIVGFILFVIIIIIGIYLY